MRYGFFYIKFCLLGCFLVAENVPVICVFDIMDKWRSVLNDLNAFLQL